MVPTVLLGFLLGGAALPGLLVAQVGAPERLREVPFPDVKVKDAFWAKRMETNAAATVPACFQKCEEFGHIDNFKRVAKLMGGEHVGTHMSDGPVYKSLEGAAYTLISHPDPKLEKYVEDLIRIVAAAQDPDGYLYTPGALNPLQPPRWSKLSGSHELFFAGHMYEAAIAHFQATRRRTFLDAAVRNADLVVKVFGEGGRPDVPGHQEIELALVRLYRATGNRRYLDQAKRFLDLRGHYEGRAPGTTNPKPEYAQDHLPVLEQASAVGHAVRALYMYSGMADVASLLNDAAYSAAVERLWRNVVDRKTYITGGLGARRQGEAFGDDYELPNDTAYAETCAAIASVFWNYRLFLASGDGKYLDVLERTLYNGLLSGVALDGERFFYVNPLASDGKRAFNVGRPTRQPWFQVPCCPTNVCRFLPSLPGYLYAVRGSEVFANLYIASEAKFAVAGNEIGLEQKTHYPWDGEVRIAVRPARPARFAVNLRLPGWARNEPLPGDLYRYADAPKGTVALEVNGRAVPLQPGKGFVRVDRLWRAGDSIVLKLPMPVRRVVSNPAVAGNRGRVAIERGPLVYCFEGADNGGTVRDVAVGRDTAFKTEVRPELLGGITVIRAGKYSAIPYYSWSHRGPGEMAVWVPLGAPNQKGEL
jgi:hypothetical protein